MQNVFPVAGLVAALLGASTAYASNFYVVVPMKGKALAAPSSPSTPTGPATPSTPPSEPAPPPPAPEPPPPLDIQMTLSSVRMPDIYYDVPYEFDFKPYLMVTGDPEFTNTQVTWSRGTAAVPYLTLREDGVLAGAVPNQRLLSYFVNVTASYKGVSVTQRFNAGGKNLIVSLAQSSIPAATPGVAYTYDFKKLLSVNYPGFTPKVDTFSLGSVPQGISLSTTVPGLLEVSPSVPAGMYTIPLTAQYYSRSASYTYQLFVQSGGYSAGQFVQSYTYDPVLQKQIATLANRTGVALTITNCQHTPAGGSAMSCSGSDVYPKSWPENGFIDGPYQDDVYRITLSNGQTIEWEPQVIRHSIQ